MECRKLTKEDIDRVRGIEGFPIGTDEDIIALSDAPYYTACPNPFIEEFIRENGTPYNEATDDYHREPYTADISEGKHDPLYMVHSYHTKVPYKAIMRYILRYTKPGDLVFDGFCGTGMTGVAALLCGDYSSCIELGEKDASNIGKRNAILVDLSTEASFIAHNYNSRIDVVKFEQEARRILDECHRECDWVYETAASGNLLLNKGVINYTILSECYICPNCSKEFVYWDAAVEKDREKMIKQPCCPHCGAAIKRESCQKAMVPCYDVQANEITMQSKCVPVRINYDVMGKRCTKAPDKEDIDLLTKIDEMRIPYWYPSTLMMHKGANWGDYWRAGYHVGLSRVNHFYTKRNLYVLAKCYDCINSVQDQSIRTALRFWISSIYSRSHKLNRYMPDHHRHVGPLSGTLYIPYFQAEINILSLLEDKLSSMMNLASIPDNSMVSTQSSTDLSNIPDESIDYTFVDPPFGDNLHYSELNFIQESWLKCFTNNHDEAIINASQKKSIYEYQELIERCFQEFYRILKPNRWITVEFHNSKNAVWNSIQEAIQKAGFIIADVHTLDKQKGTTKQLSYSMAVKQDLVISAYKPKVSFQRQFTENAGTEETAWAFVRQHLENIPVVVVKNDKIKLIDERQAYLLFDRMVAYHIMQGIPVPLDATDFYRGLDERFLKRDNMYFLPDQVNEYDTARIKTDVEPIQFEMFVTNEKSAISWLYQQLSDELGGPKTYAELQPMFMQEVKSVDRYEAMPELAVLLEENFIQDEKGRWYIPDVTKEGDIAKLREKSLWKEFESYMNSKGKLKLFRSEAIRVGFSRLWKEKNYRAIVDVAERLPEQTIQEDANLLMYYDISLGRV
ncbi:MAG: hypothetical protein LUD41_07565 [Phascolarctobacterium sp.]|nr:hypothetical protein [Phascolarctobacterium sp.]